MEGGIIGDVEPPIVMQPRSVGGLKISSGDREEVCDFFGACLVFS